MGNLAAAVVFFLAIHFGVSGTALRDRLVRPLGEKTYRRWDLGTVISLRRWTPRWGRVIQRTGEPSSSS